MTQLEFQSSSALEDAIISSKEWSEVLTDQVKDSEAKPIDTPGFPTTSASSNISESSDTEILGDAKSPKLEATVPASKLQDEVEVENPERHSSPAAIVNVVEELNGPVSETPTKEGSTEVRDEEDRVATAKRLEKARERQDFEARRIRSLETWADDEDVFEQRWNFARIAAQIGKNYLRDARATDKDPSSHSISFGPRKGETISATLAQVYALLPQDFQWMVQDINIDEAIPQYSADWNASWLDENIMNVLVHIECPEELEDKTVFGLNVASNINQKVDELYTLEFGVGFLQHMVSKMLNNPDEYKHEAKTYTFPADTERIVYFWNYSADHWVLVVTEINNEQWKHYIYNSLTSGSEWRQLLQFGGNIELLIQTLSEMPKPTYNINEGVTICRGESAYQENIEDCGIFSVYNAVMILQGLTPLLNISGAQIRHYAMCKILDELEWQFGALPEENEVTEENNDISYEIGPSGNADTVLALEDSEINDDIFYDASSSASG